MRDEEITVEMPRDCGRGGQSCKSVILSVAKNLRNSSEILRCAQNDADANHPFPCPTIFATMPPMNTLSYRPDCAELLARLRPLYERRAGDRIFAKMSLPSPTLQAFRRQYPRPECSYPDPDERADFWDHLLAERVAVEDDSLPCAYLSEFDQGLYGGLLGGEVRFLAHPDMGWVSSMVPPLLHDWSEFDRLRFDEANPWWQRYRRQMDVFIQRGAGKWGISHFILIDALNFVFELIGATETYLSIEERPELVRRAIDFGHELNVRVQREFFDRVGLFDGGTLSNFTQWIPGRIVSESLDPYHMTSVAYFERWGREPAERMLAAFDGGIIHIHGNGRHLLEAAATLKGLKAVLLMDDKGFPAAFDVIADLKRRLGDVPVAVWADCGKFADRLARHDLPGGVMYQVQNIPNLSTANRLMEQVRAYRA